MESRIAGYPFPLFILPGVSWKDRLSQKQPLPFETNAVVSGTVLNAVDNKPVDKVHVYIVHGEEEDLTNDKGQFSIRASGRFPLVLTTDHPGYDKLTVTLLADAQPQVIKLTPRSRFHR